MLTASRSSRRRRSVASASAPIPGRSAARRARAHGRVGDEVDLHLARAGATTVPMSRPSITASPSVAERALALAHHLAHLGWRATTGTSWSMSGLRIEARHVGAVDEDAAARRRSSTGCSARERRRARPPRSSGSAAREREPGERAVHRAGVEVAEAEPLGEQPRDRALAGSGRPVDGDDHRSSCGGSSQRVEQVEEAGEAYRRRLGALDLDALARDEPGDRAEHRDPVVAARVERAAARAAAGRRGRAKPSSVRADARAERAQRRRRPPRSGRSPSRAARRRRGRRCRRARSAAASAKSGSSSTSSGTSRAARSSCATSCAGRDLEVAARLAADPAAVEDGDARAHPLEHVEEAGAARVQVDAVDRSARSRRAASRRRRTARRRRSRRGSRRRRARAARPARRVTLPRLAPRRARPPPRASARCGRASGSGSIDGRLAAVGVEPGEQDRRLHLRARDRQLVARSASGGRPSIVSGACPSVVSIAAPIRAQRLGDALHRPRRESDSSPVSSNRPSWPGEQAGQQAHQRAGVAAVDRLGRRLQAAQPGAEDAERVVVDLVDARRRARGRRRASTRCRRSGRSRAIRVSPVRDRAEQHRAVRDRLVARDRRCGRAIAAAGSILTSSRAPERRRRRSPAPRAAPPRAPPPASPATRIVERAAALAARGAAGRSRRC